MSRVETYVAPPVTLDERIRWAQAELERVCAAYAASDRGIEDLPLHRLAIIARSRELSELRAKAARQQRIKQQMLRPVAIGEWR